MKLKKALIWPDTHVPDEDHRALKVMYKICDYIGYKNFSEVILLGDFADFYTVTSHAKDIGFNIKQFLMREVECVNKRLDEIDKKFTCRKVYVSGNHEYRLARYIRDKAPELYGYLDCPGLFELQSRPNWVWIPYGAEQSYKILGSKLHARHEPVGPNSKLTAQRTMANVVYGHTHRIESAQVVGLDGKNYMAYSCGWLGNKKAKSMQYVKHHAQWALGFSIVHVDPKTKFFYPQTIQIMDNYTAVYDGKIFKA